MLKLHRTYLSSEKFLGALEGSEGFFPFFVLLIIAEMKTFALLFTSVVIPFHL